MHVEVTAMSLHVGAVIAAAAAAFALGGVWYSVLFAKRWMAYQGWKPEEAAAHQQGAGPAFVATFLGWGVTSFALCLLSRHVGMDSALQGAKMGLLVWGGFFLPPALSPVFFEKKPMGLLVLNQGYQLLSLLMIGVIVTVWR